MIKYTEYYEAKETNNLIVKPINYNQETSFFINQWYKFIQANKQAMLIIFNQNDYKEALRLAIIWYHECINLAKMFYSVKETTDQIYNNSKILIENVLNANAVELERTFITTFTNVAKYQKEDDNHVETYSK